MALAPAVLAAALAVGCGRIDFESTPDGRSVDAAGADADAGCSGPICADPTFASGGAVTLDAGGSNSTFGAQAIAIAPDGGIVAVGKATPAGPARGTDLLLVAITTDGMLDTTFGVGGGVVIMDGGDPDEEAIGVTFDPGTSDLLVAGTGGDRGLVARFSRTGQLRTTFGAGGLVRVDAGETSNGVFNGIAVDAQGRITVAGQARFPLGQFNFLAARLLPTGILDSTFDVDGVVTADLGGGSDEFGTLGAAGDDRVLLAGSSYRGTSASFEGTLVALGLDGQRVDSFGMAGVAYHGSAGVDRYHGMTLDSADRILAVGVANENLLVVRHLASGAIDPSFGTAGTTVLPYGEDESLQGVVELPDGRVVAAGRTIVAGTSRALLVVLAADGTRLGHHELANATGLDHAVLDAAGRVLVVGDAAGTDAGTDDLFIARFVVP